MANVVQHVVVDGLPDVPDGTLHVGRGDDLMGPQRALVGGQDPDLPPGHLLFVDVHGLKETQRRERVVTDPSGGEAVEARYRWDLWEWMEPPYSSLTWFN